MDAIAAANRAYREAQSQRTAAYTLKIAEAQALATIAQAEQLKRIADMLEGYLSIYADPAVFSSSDPTDLPY